MRKGETTDGSPYAASKRPVNSTRELPVVGETGLKRSDDGDRALELSWKLPSRLGQRLTTYTRSNLYLVAILAASKAAAVAGLVASGGESVKRRVPGEICGGEASTGGEGGRAKVGGFEAAENCVVVFIRAGDAVTAGRVSRAGEEGLRICACERRVSDRAVCW